MECPIVLFIIFTALTLVSIGCIYRRTLKWTFCLKSGCQPMNDFAAPLNKKDSSCTSKFHLFIYAHHSYVNFNYFVAFFSCLQKFCVQRSGIFLIWTRSFQCLSQFPEQLFQSSREKSKQNPNFVAVSVGRKSPTRLLSFCYFCSVAFVSF